MATGPQKFTEMAATDTIIGLFDVEQGDIGNWRAVVDGTFCQNSAVEDGIPEASDIDVILDDRDGPVASYDSFAESNYTLGVRVPTNQKSVQEALLAGAGTFLDQAPTNLANVVGDPTVDPTDNSTGEEVYLLKLGGVSPNFTATIDRVGFMLVDPTAANYRICGYQAAGGTVEDVTTALKMTATIALSNQHKGTFDITEIDDVLGLIVLITYDPNTEYFIDYVGGDRKRVDYIDDTLEAGDTAAIFTIAYWWGQLPSTSDYQIDLTIARSKRQQVALYRPLGNSTDSRIWKRRLFPDCRLTRPPAESTGTGQNAVNSRLFEYRVERLTHPNANSDFYVDQVLQYPLS